MIGAEMKPKTLYVKDRDEWRRWLEKNHLREKEIWLVYYKKHADKPTIPYDDAVEEALCFGWIDSLVKRVDDEKYMQKYTPRNEKSIWSKINKRRAAKMIEHGRMTDFGLKKIEAAKKSDEWSRASSISERPSAEVPEDLKRALDRNKKAKQNFFNFAPSYQKQYIWWILSAKRDETRAKRIKETVDAAAKNRKPGLK